MTNMIGVRGLFGDIRIGSGWVAVLSCTDLLFHSLVESPLAMMIELLSGHGMCMYVFAFYRLDATSIN